VIEEIDRLLGEGKHIAVTVAEEQELLSPQHAADRLGFSRQHIVRLINAGELEAHKLPRGLPCEPGDARAAGSDRAPERTDRGFIAWADFKQTSATATGLR
jgi:excisionase family DNA binding protein